ERRSRPSSSMAGRSRSAPSMRSASEDRPGAIGGGAGMPSGVHRQSAVRARRPPRRQHRLRLREERPHLLGTEPEPGARQVLLGRLGGLRLSPALALALTLALALGARGRSLPGDDHEAPLGLVVAEAELADDPIRV